ncbi:MAG: restriction endonuclease subunit S [Alphaproteobacteria bacterium]|nr:restriction endonuclease subunit S [Alphaproteobacteria bacterium]
MPNPQKTTYKIKDLAVSNKQNFNFRGIDHINYVDTSSIIENTINCTQRLNCNSDIIPSRAKKAVGKNTIIYSAVRPNLKHYGLIKKPLKNMVVSTGFITLDLMKEIDPAYFYYNLTQQKYTDFLHTVAINNASAYPAINPSDLENLEIDIFDSLQTQKDIGNFLSALDDKIELNNKINSEFEAMARALYDYWFVQFDFPDGKGRPYKSAGGAMVYSDILKRDIPAGWEVKTLAENNLAKILKPGITKFDGEKTYLATACIENDRITDCSNKITFDNREGRANMQPIANSVWFAKMKNTKKVLYFGDYSSERIAGLIISTGMLGLQCQNYALEYIWNLINNDVFEVLKNKLSHGATQEGVNNDDLAFIPVVVPSQEILEQYSALVKPIYQQKYLNEREAEHLATLRDFLLPMLMNGQVCVAN